MNFKQFLGSHAAMRLLENVEVSENLKYHIENNIGLRDNVFRIYSKAYFDLVNEVRELYQNDSIALDDHDADLVESDLGKVVELEGGAVFLDAPFLESEQMDEAVYKGKHVNLGKPFRTPGESKKFAVYVKTKSGRIKKIRFGDPNLTVKNDNPARAKSFRARHKCSQKKDRETAGYWACRTGSFAKSLGLKSSKSW